MKKWKGEPEPIQAFVRRMGYHNLDPLPLHKAIEVYLKKRNELRKEHRKYRKLAKEHKKDIYLHEAYYISQLAKWDEIQAINHAIKCMEFVFNDSSILMGADASRFLSEAKKQKKLTAEQKDRILSAYNQIGEPTTSPAPPHSND